MCKFFSGPASKAGRTKPTGRPCRTRVFRKVASRLRETDMFACCENSGIAQEAEYCNSSRQIRHFLKSALGALATHFSKKSPNRPWPPQPEVRLANLASEPPGQIYIPYNVLRVLTVLVHAFCLGPVAAPTGVARNTSFQLGSITVSITSA